MKKHYTEEEKKKFLHKLYHEEELTLKQIANIFGVSESTICSRMKKLGIKANKQGRRNSEATNGAVHELYNHLIYSYEQYKKATKYLKEDK